MSFLSASVRLCFPLFIAISLLTCQPVDWNCVLFVVLQIALGCCLLALFSMCLWFVRVTVAQRRRQIILEMQWAANQPPVMSEEDIAALTTEHYKVRRACFGLAIFELDAAPSGMRAGLQLVLCRPYHGVVQPLPAGPDGAIPAETCSVCLTDFEAEEEIRRLPCRHLFHTGVEVRSCLAVSCLHVVGHCPSAHLPHVFFVLVVCLSGCIDTWLVRSVLCPMCKADVRPGGGQGAPPVAGDAAPEATGDDQHGAADPHTTPGQGHAQGAGAGEGVVGSRSPGSSLGTNSGYSTGGTVAPVVPVTPSNSDRVAPRPMASSASASGESGRSRTFRRSQTSTEMVTTANPAAHLRPAEQTPRAAGEGRAWSPPGTVHSSEPGATGEGNGGSGRGHGHVPNVPLPGSADGLEL
jgi:hypothetical protein